MPEDQQMSDHDTLITLLSEVRQIRTDIADLKDGTTAKITDHEMRLRRIETWGAILLGISYAMQFYLNYMK